MMNKKGELDFFFFFLHFDQLFSHQKLNELESFLGASLNRDFLDPKLSRTNSCTRELNGRHRTLYKELNLLSGFN